MSTGSSALADAVSGPPQIDPSTIAASAQPAPNVSSQPPMPVLNESGTQDSDAGASTQPTSRLQSILSAVAKVGSTALSGVPAGNRPSFLGGLGQGARAENAAQATQQNIKFKDFDNQVRAANLHAQDLELQMRTQAQQDAHQKMQDDQQDWDTDHGIDYNPIPNTGDAVMNHLQAQTSATGSASIPTGTHLSADGNSINIPADTQATRDGQLQKYNAFGPLYGLPSLPEGAKFVPPRLNDLLTHVQQGYGPDSHPVKHDDLPGAIASLQTQRDTIAKGANNNPAQLNALDNTIGILKSNLTALDSHAAGVAQQTALSKKAGEIAADNSPEGQALLARQNAGKAALQDNAAGNKPQKVDSQMYVGTDATGNQIAGTANDLQTAGAQGVTKLDSDTGKKVIVARQLISPQGLFSQIAQDMTNLDAKGKLGSSATARINDALLQKAGSDPDYAPLFVHTHLLSTALMQAHVGSRGSSDMMSEFQKLADAGKMNAQTLAASLSAERRYVKEKAMLPQPVAQSGGGQ